MSENNHRLLASWQFEDGERFSLYCTAKVNTLEVFDVLEQLIALRRAKIAKAQEQQHG